MNLFLLRIDPDTRTRREKTHYLLWAGAWLAVTVIALLISPSKSGHGTHQQLGLPPCGAVMVFQRPCPGCGLTTSFAATVRGQFEHAWNSNPFGPIFYGMFTLTALLALFGYATGRRINSDGPVYRGFMFTLIAGFMAWGMWRFATERIPASEVVSPQSRLFQSVLGHPE